MEADAGVCASRNVHKRTRKEIDALLQSWQPTPAHMNKVTLLGYFQDQEIDNVDMELEQESPGDSTLPTDTACRGEVIFSHSLVQVLGQFSRNLNEVKLQRICCNKKCD